MTKQLVDKESIAQVLGCFIKNPNILEEKGVELWRDDFPELFHTLVYATAFNLHIDGAQHIDSIALDSYLSKYPNQYSVFNDNNGVEYVERIVELAELSNFEYNFNRVRKFTMLRELVASGIDISDIYDDTIISQTEHEEMQGKFDKMSISDISNAISGKFMVIEDKFLSEDGQKEQHAGLGMAALKENLKKNPEYGSPLNGDILNTIIRGARRKKLYAVSGNSGSGKCVVGSTLVQTDKGVIPIKDIPKYYEVKNKDEVEANIISYDVNTGKKMVLPTSNWYNLGEAKTIKLKTKRGYEIEGTLEHPIVVGDGKGGYDFKKLGDIKEGELAAISINNNLFGDKEIDLDIAYVMGVLIGDGSLAEGYQGFAYTNGNKNIYENVNQLAKDKINGVTNVRMKKDKKLDTYLHIFGNRETKKQLVDLGLPLSLSRDKYVPESIMQGTEEVVKSFLQGLFDTDGSITVGQFEFSSASERLANEVHLLLNNFGITGTRRTKQVNGTDYYIITLMNYNAMRLFKEKIGFRFELNKKARLESRLQDSNTMNSNVDLVYDSEALWQLHEYMKINCDEYRYSKKYSENYVYKGYSFYGALARRSRGSVVGVSRERIQRIMNHLDFDSLPLTLQKLHHTVNNFFFDEIVSVEESKDVVYDFTVPITHSFVSNGFVSHNTRLALGNAMKIGLPAYYCNDKHDWVSLGVSEPVLFITTELEEEEVQTMMIAYTSGVNEEKILDGNYTPDEEARVDRAIEIIMESPIRLSYTPNFNIEEVERVIKRHIMSYDVRYVFFDYLHSSMKLLEEIAKASRGMALREDNVLYMFSASLKQMCNDHDVFIYTGTQVNGDYKHATVLDEGVLRGA